MATPTEKEAWTLGVVLLLLLWLGIASIYGCAKKVNVPMKFPDQIATHD